MSDEQQDELEEAVESLDRIDNVWQLLAAIDDDPSFLQPKRPAREDEE
jgi:hypothetical protein